MLRILVCLLEDARPPCARRWCSMQACGNRAKTRRHYLRRKAG
ncbi:CGNR zinc finger domain-containing protein [Candidatus Binatus sp.]